MADIRRERKINRIINGRPLPAIVFRYSKNTILTKTDIKFARVQRAEIYIHVQGTCNVFIGNRTYRMNPGDVLIYNKDEIHFSTILPETVFERFVILFYPEYIDFICDLSVNLFNFFYERTSYEQNLVSLSEDKRRELLEILYAVDQYAGKDEFDRDLFAFNNCIRIFQIINEGYLHPQGNRQTQRTPRLINEIIQFINRAYAQNLTLESMARQMNISQSYLSSAFKKYVGVSPYEYLLNVRLDHAKRMLANGASIEEACYDSGFNNYSHFIQFFKKRTGTTPYKYQKNHTPAK